MPIQEPAGRVPCVFRLSFLFVFSSALGWPFLVAFNFLARAGKFTIGSETNAVELQGADCTDEGLGGFATRALW